MEEEVIRETLLCAGAREQLREGHILLFAQVLQRLGLSVEQTTERLDTLEGMGFLTYEPERATENGIRHAGWHLTKKAIDFLYS